MSDGVAHSREDGYQPVERPERKGGREERSGNRRPLEDPEGLLRRIQDVAGVGAWEYDPDADATVGTGQLYRLLEIPEDTELDLEAGLRFYPPDARDTVKAAVQQCLTDGTPFDLEVPLETAEGNRRWVRLRGQLYQTEDGKHLLTGTLQDISGRKEIEETLRKEQTVLRQMYRITSDRTENFESKTQQLIDLGREYLGLPYGFLTRVTDTTQRIIQASGTHPLLQPGESCPISESYCRMTVREESLLSVQDAPAEGWDGDPAFETFGLGSYIGAKVIVDGELYGTFCFAGDEAREKTFADHEKTFVELLSRWTSYELGEKKTAEQLRHRNERLDRLSSVVSHDLRNPLNVAQGRVQLAQEEGRVDSTAEEHLRAASHAHDRINTIIQDMLALTWSGQDLELEDTETLGLRKVAQASWEQIETKEATLQVEGDLRIHAHEGRLRQLLENLFRNAVEHGGDGVTVWVGALPDGFYVEDDGPGIPEAEREKVFEAGYSTEKEGTGLGLSIVETVAEAHGWAISVTEGRRGGTRFEVSGVEAES